MGSEGALRNGGSHRGLRQRRRRGSAAEIDRAAMVPRRRRQPRRMSEANNDGKTSFEKSCKELPRIGVGLRTARNPAGTNFSFGVRSWRDMKNRSNGFYGEVRLRVPGWTGDNRLRIPKCSTLKELARGIDAALFFSGEEPHYLVYPEGHFHRSELENAKETETRKSFLGRMVEKYSKDDRELAIRTPISPPISASSTAEDSEDNANPHRNPAIAESSQSLQAPQPPIASAQKTADILNDVTDDDFTEYIRWIEDPLLSPDGVESNGIAGFSIVSSPEAMPGAQNHSPDSVKPWYDTVEEILSGLKP
ncbi:unnamed protein product [Sphagnum jensenii]|uniref:Uncharacterized protein n=1 Tax=Sphagnum jensenii TaxID=128206 RepID=A0ABP1AVH8_9BRYO